MEVKLNENSWVWALREAGAMVQSKKVLGETPWGLRGPVAGGAGQQGEPPRGGLSGAWGWCGQQTPPHGSCPWGAECHRHDGLMGEAQ